MTELTRRRILEIGIVSAAAAVVGGTFTLRPITQDELLAYLRAHFAHLNVPDETVLSFLEAYLTHFEPVARNFEGQESFAARTMPDLDEPSLAMRFLLSTDWFEHEDSARSLAFRALYDPYVSPCYNPLAALSKG